MTTTTVEAVRVLGLSEESVREAHSIFEETLGPSNVEDVGSLLATVSPSTDDAVVSKLVGAFDDDRLVGAMLGLYLRKRNAGMMLYAGVDQSFRGRGIYTKMREMLLSELAVQSSSPLRFILSEIEVGHWLARKYVDEWNGFVAPCDYLQPAAQGLPRRRLNLIVMPISQRKPEIVSDLRAIIHEVFRGIYRIAEPERHPDFRHAVESVRM